MAARLARMAANMAASFTRSAVVASSRGQCHTAAGSGRLAPVSVFHVRALRSPLCAAPGTRLRDFSASAAPSAAAPEIVSPIVDVVQQELSYEKENYSKPEMSSLPEGWTISEKAGDSKVTLTRQFGDEIIQVDFTARQLEEDDDEYEDDVEEEEVEDGAGEDDIIPLDEVSIEVAVMKANSDKALVFEAETNGDYLRILDVSLEAISPVEPEGDDLAAEALEDEDVDEDTLYRGPVFSELDDKLQQAFMDFLSQRGVDAELGQFIVEFSDDKEQREYMHWLEGVHAFLKT